jgi:hypothetical protein
LINQTLNQMKNKYFIFCFFICVISANVFAQNNADIQCKFIQFPMAIKQNTSNTIKVKVTNLGKDLHEEIVANFAIDNEVSGTKNISLAILHQQSQEITFTHLFNLPVSDHKLKVWFTDKLNNSLNSIETEFFVARTTVPQLPLIEEFTSSTCGPCASFNVMFDPFLASINANEDGGQLAAVKYQMNWPAPDDDPSYNNDGSGRRSMYAVNAIPKTYLNGVATATFDQSVIDAASGESAFNLVPYFYLSGDTVKATSSVTPYTASSTPLRVYLALTEDFYTYTGGTTSQTTFHYVMRKMLPNYVGTVISNINEDTIYTINKNYKVTYGSVTPGSYNIWGTSAGFTLVSWVQNPTTKVVFQAGFANTPSALNVSEKMSSSALEIYPNPSNESFTIKLDLNEKADVSYTLNDLTGRLMQQPIMQELPAGKHVIQTSTQDLLPGIYICTIKTNTTCFTERIVVAK